MNEPRTDGRQAFGLRPGELRLAAVGPEWARRFARERARLRQRLGAAALDIQHLGSTAIPGLVAKPILDVGVAIESFEAGFALVPWLQGVGYRYRGENGIPRRHYFERGRPEAWHLHLFERGGKDWRRHLRFRDQLLRHPELARRYARLKTAAVQACGGDREAYQRMKSAFIAEVQGL